MKCLSHQICNIQIKVFARILLFFGNLILFYFICLNPQYLWSIFLKKRYILECMIRCGGCLSIGKYIRVAQHFYFGLSLLELYFTHILLSSALIGMYEMAR